MLSADELQRKPARLDAIKRLAAREGREVKRHLSFKQQSRFQLNDNYQMKKSNDKWSGMGSVVQQIGHNFAKVETHARLVPGPLI